MADTDWVYVCAPSAIPVRGARVVKRTQGAPIALFRTETDGVFALLDRCPHKGGPLSQGMVCGDSVTCPLHNFVIALDSGEVAAPDEGRTERFTVRLDGDAVYLNRLELRTVGITVPECETHARL